jgi:ankyrin repeat protein
MAAPNDREMRGFINAAQSGNIKGMESFLRSHPDSLEAKWHGRQALLWAAQWGRVESVVFLLQQGANINAVDDQGFTAYKWAYTNNTTNRARDVMAVLEKNPNFREARRTIAPRGPGF